MFYVTVNDATCANAHKLRGWFPTRELAEAHVKSWPADISSEMAIYDESEIKFDSDDGSRHPPEHLQKSVAKALNDHNANIARMVSHGIDPKEPDDVQKAWIERVKEENRASYDAMIATAFQIAFEAGMKAGEWKPWGTAPRDGSYFDAWVEPSHHVTRVYYDGDNFRVGNYSGVIWLSEIGTPTHWRQGQEGPKK